MSFDRKTGDLWIGDVGQNAYEEISFLPAGSAAGMNFGWSKREGKHPYSNSCADSGIPRTEPLYDYAHGSEGCSIKLRALTKTGAGTYVSAAVADSPFTVSSLGEDVAGELYVVGYSESGGALYHITSTDSTAAPTATPAPTVDPATLKEKVYLPVIRR
jgi:hypothetical protein